MGRQPYLTSLALGRYALELPEDAAPRVAEDPPLPRQRYDRRGHPVNPESRAIARDLTKAQNDVLATCGMLRHDDQPDHSAVESRSSVAPGAGSHFDTDKQEVDLAVRENQIGVLYPLVAPHLGYVCTWWMVAIRNRYQTFWTYSDVPYLEALRVQRRHQGWWGLTSAGLPAELLHTVLNNAKGYLLFQLVRVAFRLVMHFEPNRKRREAKGRMVMWAFHTLDMASWVALAPLQMFATLQALGLIPVFPLLPSLRSMMPFSSSSPLQLPSLGTNGFTARTAPSMVLSILTSPVILLWIHWQIRTVLFANIGALLRTITPRPENPDPTSVQAAMEQDLDPESIPGIEPTEPTALHQWLDGILQHIRRIGSLGSRQAARNLSPPRPRRRLGSFGVSLPILPPGLGRVRGRSSGDSMHDQGRRPSLDEHEQAIDEPPVSELDVEPPSTVLDANLNVPLDGDASISHRRRRSSVYTDDFHGDQDLNDEELRDHRAHLDRHRLHRVTALSAFPAMSAVSIAASFFATYLTLPIESLFLRTVALSYLGCANTPAMRANAGVMSAQVFAPWAGLGLSGNTGNRISEGGSYLRRIAFCAGVEMLGSFGLFELGYLGVSWVGRGVYGWGRL